MDAYEERSWYFFSIPVYHKSRRHKNSNYLRPIPVWLSRYFFGPSSVSELNCGVLNDFSHAISRLENETILHTRQTQHNMCVWLGGSHDTFYTQWLKSTQTPLPLSHQLFDPLDIICRRLLPAALLRQDDDYDVDEQPNGPRVSQLHDSAWKMTCHRDVL